MFKKRAKKDQKVLQLSDNQNNEGKIDKNNNDQNNEEDQQNLNSQPRKMIKIQLPKQKINLISSRTTQYKQKKNEQNNVIGMNYKASDNLKKKQRQEVIEQGIPYQQIQAKEKFMNNLNMTKLIKQGKLSTKVYRGQNAYADYSLTSKDIQNAQQSYKTRHGAGPAKGSNRNICRFDYDKSLCKDWHDSGYCVFGDSCIYLHDRSNYKTGWELQKQFEQNQRQRWKRINNPDYIEKPAYLQQVEKYKIDEICKNCQNQFKNPVEVQCGHVFCTKCALKLNQSPGKCCICSKKLNGIMNNAQKSLKSKKELYEKMLKKHEKQDQQFKGRRSKYRDLNSLDVFTAQ